jgi:spermidine synthase
MKQRPSIIALLVVLVATLAAAVPSQARVIYKQKSLYRNISVTDNGRRVCLRFTTHRQGPSWQSCQLKRDPDKLVFDYTRMMMSGLLLDPKPRRILIAGLGGGTIPSTLHKLYPKAHIDTAEIDPAVLKVAQRFFHFRQSAHQNVIIQDARVYVRHALASGKHYDLIFLDAFNGDYIPFHLMTKEFLTECRRLLSRHGVVVANTFSTSKLYDSESVTYKKVFGWFLNLKRRMGNRIILTRKGPPVSPAKLRAKARHLQLGLGRFGVDIGKIAALASNKRDWNKSAPVLTDQYAPVNLLNGPRH